ncbi:cell wall hydrolase [Paenibacillus sp. P96]|uniref:Cell wall hydrolase n=1 Tax=Paenibacillus zeirhizosphaerae TaxID=2987519 RepID=A0ABT9FWR1_9BACL|nr:cell wall hydrolase [Paenibacillus sp. P96]MDP4098966.1 cell wall hydrolase [Paenibacillus sp. P96]
MEIIKQHRWIAPLLSVLIVSILGISLVVESQNAQTTTAAHTANALQWPAATNDEKGQDRSQSMHIMDKTSSSMDELHSWKSLIAPLLIAQVEKAAQTAKNDRSASKQAAPAIGKIKIQSQTPPKKLFFTRTATLTQADQAKATWSYSITAQEVLLLQKIVMAEAEGESYKGKVAVANVVLNRLRSANFPDTIQKVIYQKAQFSPVANGRLNRVRPNEETVKAVNDALSGHKAVPDDTYYFLSLTLADDLTVHHSRAKVKTIGNHTFYK